MTKIGITERGDAAIYLNIVLQQLYKVDAAILITKNPTLLYNSIDKLRDLNIIIHCTITGAGNTFWEPGVPDSKYTLQAYHNLIDIFGPDRVVLRVDPIIPTNETYQRAKTVIAQAKGRIRISFMDFYKHNIPRITQKLGEYTIQGLKKEYGTALHLPLLKRQTLLADLQSFTTIPIEVCGEPGITCTGCISDYDLNIFGLPKNIGISNQRNACQCSAYKTELLNFKKQCPHKCVYCYWR